MYRLKVRPHSEKCLIRQFYLCINITEYFIFIWVIVNSPLFAMDPFRIWVVSVASMERILEQIT